VYGTSLDSLVDTRHKGAMLGCRRLGVAFCGGRLETVEVSLDGTGKASVLDALTLGAKDSFFL